MNKQQLEEFLNSSYGKRFKEDGEASASTTAVSGGPMNTSCGIASQAPEHILQTVQNSGTIEKEDSETEVKEG